MRSSDPRGPEPTAPLNHPDRPAGPPRPRRVHPAWPVAAVTFVALVGAAAFRSAPGVLIEPLHHEFGWSRGTIGGAVSVNLVLFGLFSPFAAALMDRFGMRRVVLFALLLVSAGTGLTVFMTQSWQLLMLWGVLVGVGTGSMSMAFVATATSRWFVKRVGLVSGVLTAAGATGQLVFLPLVALLAEHHGWRVASLVIAGASLAVVPLVLLFLHNHPADLGIRAYGATDAEPGPPKAQPVGSSAGRALGTLAMAVKHPGFWLLAGGFAICGASTNGLISTHFVPAAHDHGMPTTMAAGLLAVVGIFDIAGTVFSGWLTDRFNPRLLLAVYYVLRGLSLTILPQLFAPHTEPPMWVFIIFYGLDWVATVPPTVALCRELFGTSGPVVFGWVFASHQLGAALAATVAGLVRDHLGQYDLAFVGAGVLCLAAATMSVLVPRHRARTTDPA